MRPPRPHYGWRELVDEDAALKTALPGCERFCRRLHRAWRGSSSPLVFFPVTWAGQRGCLFRHPQGNRLVSARGPRNPWQPTSCSSWKWAFP